MSVTITATLEGTPVQLFVSTNCLITWQRLDAFKDVDLVQTKLRMVKKEDLSDFESEVVVV